MQISSEERMYKGKSDKEQIGKIHFHEQIHAASKENRSLIGVDEKKVLIIHTGGTIGMFKDENGKFKPEPHMFENFLRDYPYFTDEDETYFNSVDDFMITPVSIFGKKIWYKFHEFENLIDSTNMSIERFNIILNYLKEVYDKYDAFIILHGTDTLSYTASALSFMVENLKKTVIITGAQVPIGEIRNDAVNNLLCALTIAGHYTIPEILVVFDNNILRGNRTTKTSASSFDSFRSPNFRALGHLGMKIEILWELIKPCKHGKETVFHELEANVGVIKLTPFGFNSPPKEKYLVIESFGVGNIPTEGKFYEWVKENSTKEEKDRCVIVNISQVYQSVILNLYATGNEAVKLGMISGSDMTCESAVAKLSFLATKKLSFSELKDEMIKNYRGELTEDEDRVEFEKDIYSISSMNMLQRTFEKHPEEHRKILKNIVYPQLIIDKPSRQAITRMMEFGTDLKTIFPDGGNLLHHYCRDESLTREQHNDMYLKLLLENGVDTSLIDKKGNSALFYAIESGKYKEAEMIQNEGGKLKTTAKRVFKAIRNKDITLLHALAKFGDEFKYKNEEERNCLVYSIICNQKEIFSFLCDFTELAEDLGVKDIYGRTVGFYINQSGYEVEITTKQEDKDVTVV